MELVIKHTYELVSATATEVRFHVHTAVNEDDGSGNHTGTLVLDVAANVWRFRSHELWTDSNVWAFEAGTSHLSVMCQIEDSYRAAFGEAERYGNVPAAITFEDCDSGAVAWRGGEVVATICMIGSPSWFDHTRPEPVLEWLRDRADCTEPVTIEAAKKMVTKALHFDC